MDEFKVKFRIGDKVKVITKGCCEYGLITGISASIDQGYKPYYHVGGYEVRSDCRATLIGHCTQDEIDRYFL